MRKSPTDGASPVANGPGMMASPRKGHGGRLGPPPTTIRKPLADNLFGWEDMGRCRGEEFDAVNFFPLPKETAAIEEAKKVCRGCVVRGRCLEFAVVNEIEYGIWGGTMPSER